MKKTGWTHPGLATSTRGILLALPLLAALSGCGSDDPPAQAAPVVTTPPPATNPVPPVTDPVTPETPVTPLCAASLDYGTTFTGASSGGEYIKIGFDTTTRRYRMTFVASAVPTAAGQVNQTRTGLTIEGSFTHPTTLPTAEQNRCAFVLQDGQTADASYAVTINPANPPMLFAGFDAVTGGTPGATIQYDGVALLGNLGAVPGRTFDSFPFIGFAQTETDLSQVAGRYHEVGMYMSPTGTSYQTARPQGWGPEPANWTETLNADGSCTAEGTGYSCSTTGTPWTRRQNADLTQDNVFISRSRSSGSPYASVGIAQPIILLSPTQAHGIMIVGKVGTQRIPVIVRIGYSFIPAQASDLLNTIADAQVGLSLLAPATALQPNAFDGTFVGVTSAALCGKVTYDGSSGAPAVSTGVFDATVDHPDLPGTYNGIYFLPDMGNCVEGTGTRAPAATYVASLFSGTGGTQAGAATTATTPSFTLDYAQPTPGKVNLGALQAFNAADPSGDVALFQAGDAGVLVRNGPIYALIMNANTYHPFVQFGMALP